MTYRVLAIRADRGGCAKYRVSEPARVVNEAFDDFEVEVKPDINASARRDRITRVATVLRINEDVDLISIQRPLNSDLYHALVQAKKQGIATCIELDDDFEMVHKNNIAWQGVQPHIHPLSNWQWIHKAADIVDWMTVSTPALERYASHGRVSVVRNYVPRREIIAPGDKTASGGSIRVGWSGTIQTHPADLDVTRGGVARGVTEVGGRISVVGDIEGVERGLSASGIGIEATGWVDLEDYHHMLRDNIDIGIVPLENSAFNRAKSSLKGLEYAAAGIPFISSDLPEYRRIHAYGLGELATSPGDWRRWITRWAKDDRWLEIGEKYRQIVEKEFVLEDHANEWADAWRSAINQNRASSKISSWTSAATPTR